MNRPSMNIIIRGVAMPHFGDRDWARKVVQLAEARERGVDTYNMYKDSDNEEKLSWAEQARMRANKTANSYNEYVLKNSYVWNGNVPIDIANYLPTI